MTAIPCSSTATAAHRVTLRNEMWRLVYIGEVARGGCSKKNLVLKTSKPRFLGIQYAILKEKNDCHFSGKYWISPFYASVLMYAFKKSTCSLGRNWGTKFPTVPSEKLITKWIGKRAAKSPYFTNTWKS